jgi:hypothetical protein
MECYQKCNDKNERGIALITALLASAMILALGMAVVFSATSSTVTTMSQRSSEQAFLAADAGIAIARRSLSQAIDEQITKIVNGNVALFSTGTATAGTFPDFQVLPDPSTHADYYAPILTRASQLATDSARMTRLTQLDGSSFAVNYNNLTGSISDIKLSSTQGTEVVVLRYSTQVTGKTQGGATATVDESGFVSSNINLSNGAPAGNRNFSFSGFSVFFDSGDPIWNAVLVPGTYSGPVHTNTDFSFYAWWNYTFRNKVTQVNPNIRYWLNDPNNWIPIPNQSIQGINLGAQGYHQASAIPLPQNNFSQEYAVINATGITTTTTGGSPVDPPPVIPRDGQGNPLPVFDSNGKVLPNVLAANMRDSSNGTITLQSGALPNGVYIASADGTSITGAGFYIQGDAQDFKLYADTNGDQVYVITQNNGSGNQTTTIRVSYANGNTVVTSPGGTVTTYTGLPTDKSDPAHPTTGAMVFSNGSIWSLRGGTDGSQNVPAIASQTHLTITSTRHVKLTGDIKYADPVVNPDGTPVANIANVQNVLGIFTNDGNIYLDAKPAYVSGGGLNIQMNGAFCVFNSNTADDNGQAEGGITTWFGSGHITPNSSDAITLIGSDVEALNSLVDYYNANEYYDVRFSGGSFRPPFFPGTQYSLNPGPAPTAISIVNFDLPAATAMTWFRESK